MLRRSAVLLALVLAGCSGEGPTATTPPADPPGTAPGEASPVGEWVVTGLTVDGEVVDLIPDAPITVFLNLTDIGGTSACNSYGGPVSIDLAAGTFSVGGVASTDMACMAEGVMELEQAYLGALEQIDSYTLDGDLRLTGGTTTITLAHPAAPADTGLTDERWLLDTVVEGDTASNSAAMADVHLEFARDGTFFGFTGCRDVTGTWELDGDTLRVPVATAPSKAAITCQSEYDALDETVMAVLGSSPVIDLAEHRLTLTATDGPALVFGAEPRE